MFFCEKTKIQKVLKTLYFKLIQKADLPTSQPFQENYYTQIGQNLRYIWIAQFSIPMSAILTHNNIIYIEPINMIDYTPYEMVL